LWKSEERFSHFLGCHRLLQKSHHLFAVAFAADVIVSQLLLELPSPAADVNSFFCTRRHSERSEVLGVYAKLPSVDRAVGELTAAGFHESEISAILPKDRGGAKVERTASRKASLTR